MKNINLFSKLFSKTKEKLLLKINEVVSDEKIKEEYRKYFESWKIWFYNNKENIKLDDLSDTNNFYRAYYHEGIFGIQIWELDSEGLISWKKNLYVSEPDILDDPDTIILNQTC